MSDTTARPDAADTSRSAARSGDLPGDVLTELTALFDAAVTDNRTAGITWAIVSGHGAEQLLLAQGAAGDAELRDGEPAPGSTPMAIDSISRIASMTKSFTAAAILRLRDQGRLRLDDPLTQHVPEAAGITPATPDSPEITLRDLLTMSAGLVTDNPWGDRQEAMTREDFAAMIARGLGHVHAPGTGFEYSNTGYALLGRVVDEVSGSGYAAYITETFLRPLGMDDSGFALEEVDRERVATGHRVGPRTDRTRFEPVPFDRPGVYGSMAGLYSTPADIARWVRFLAAADAAPAGTAAPGETAAPHPGAEHAELLSSASRRQMQQLHRLQATPALPAGPDGVSPGFDRVRGYGFGLAVERFPDLGDVLSHGGGYPGYGSYMCWHRDSGVGVVALANSKYAPASVLSMQAMRILARGTDLLAPRRAQADPRALEAAAGALQWLRDGDDAVADLWFADNMDLDTPREERRAVHETALAAGAHDRGVIGSLTVEGAEVLSRAHLRWTLPPQGEGATVRIDMLLDPRREALIQALDVTADDQARKY